MMQRRPNPTELKSMDSYTPIFCRFQKSKQNVPLTSLPCIKKSLGGKGNFLVQGSGNIKFGHKNPSILTPLDSVDIASQAERLVFEEFGGKNCEVETKQPD